MARADLRFDHSPITIEHASARGKIQRNAGSYTRGAGLIGQNLSLWRNGTKTPFYIWLGLLIAITWIMMSAIMGDHEIQLCSWRIGSALWTWMDLDPFKPMNIILTDGTMRKTSIGYIPYLPDVQIAWIKAEKTLLGSFLAACIIAFPAVSLYVRFANKLGSRIMEEHHERGATLVTRDILYTLIVGYNREKFNEAAAKLFPKMTLKQVGALPFEQLKAAGLHHPYSLGGLPYPYKLEASHAMVIGTTGSGKTTQLRALTKQIRERQDSAVIFDLTGDFVKAFYNPETDTILNPGAAQTTVMDKNLRQRNDQLRTVAALANRGRAGDALDVLGSAVISTPDRTAAAAALWLGLAPADREQTLILTSGRQARRDLNIGIQDGLKAEGSLGTVGKTLTVVEQVDRTREDMRHARNYEPGLTLSLGGDEKSLGLKRGDYKVARFIKGGKVQLERDGKKTIIDPKRLSPSRREDRLTMTATKDLTLHEGDKIRWTANDKARHLHNSAIGRVVAVDAKGVTIEAADKSVVRLAAGDPMLRRLDLAYAINMHMAQGVTTDKAIIVMGSEERMLANQRLFNVGITRARDRITVVTDDKAKLARQLDKTPGDKLSALEVTGQLEANIALSTPPPPAPPVAQTLAPTQAARSAPVQPTPADLSPAPIPPLPAAQPGLAPAPIAAAPAPPSPAPADKAKPAPAPSAAPATTPDRLKVHELSVPKLEKNLGLEL